MKAIDYIKEKFNALKAKVFKNSTPKIKYRSFEEARTLAQSLHLENVGPVGYFRWADRPEDMPADPRKVYKKQWICWEDFLTPPYNQYGYSNRY